MMVDKKVMKKTGKRVVLALTVIWMLVIFVFSSQPADESTRTSLFIGEMIESVCVPGFVDLSAEEKRHMAENIDFFVRKTAHATEYAVLGVLLGLSMGEFTEEAFYKKQYRPYIVGTAYAGTDEIHQLFVPGRAGLFTDVMIDSAGVLAGILLLCVLKKITERTMCSRRLFVA